ncbi:MAG: J domain-containing protein [Okeania sp. SIO2H7]|nr:J domain-containing protein [Okeania sp. SIO2H7]
MVKTTATSNHYQTLEVSPRATQRQIKQAYRRLAKIFHPDSNSGCSTSNEEEIVRINAAYEILGDPQKRKTYDRQISPPPQQQKRDAYDRHYKTGKYRGNAGDTEVEKWLNLVYKPIDRKLKNIIYALEKEIDELSADPFDDSLLEAFQSYLEKSGESLQKAQNLFRSQANPSNVAGVAANLYYCLDRVGDGIEQLELFTYNYDDYYLHTGQELFRIAEGLRREAGEKLTIN